jgi:hypothetical protein
MRARKTSGFFSRHGPNRNGARHCCQAPLRRAKDLPVFATLISQPEGPKTRPRSWLTSSGVAFHRGGPKTRFLVRFSSRKSLAPQFPSAWPEGFRDLDVPRPFLGRVPSTRLCLPGGETALVQGSTNSSGASCRLVRNSVRCVIALADSSASNLIPSPAGGDRSFRHSPHRLAVAGLLERRGLPSRSQLERGRGFRVAPSGKCGSEPVDNGDIAHKSRFAGRDSPHHCESRRK